MTLILDEIKEYFKETNAEGNARLMLQNLKQGNKSVDAYTATFNDWVTKAGWNESTEMDVYRRGLNSDIRRDLIRMDKKATTLKDLQEKALEFGQDAELEQFYNKGVTFRSNPASEPLGSRHNPIEINAYQRLSPEEYQKRRDSNSCLACGQQGHYARNCPNTPNPGPSRGGFRGRGTWRGRGRGFNRNFTSRNYQEYQDKEETTQTFIARFQDLMKNATPSEAAEATMFMKEAFLEEDFQSGVN